MRITRIVTWAVAAVIGLVYGAAGTIGQAVMWGLFPVGLIVAIIGTSGLLVAVRSLTADRWAGLATALGVMLITLVLSGRGPGGSIVVPAPADGELSTGLIWTVAVPVVAAVVIAWPQVASSRRRGRSPDTGPLGDHTTSTN